MVNFILNHFVYIYICAVNMKMHFLGRKINFLSLKFFLLKSWRINIYEYLKTFYERQNLCLNKPRTYFFVWNLIRIYFTDIKSFFNLDNLEPAPGRLAPELEIKAIKIHEISPSLRTRLTISSTKSTRLFQTYIFVFHNMFLDIHKC